VSLSRFLAGVESLSGRRDITPVLPGHHAALWADTLAVERLSLAVNEEVAT